MHGVYSESWLMLPPAWLAWLATSEARLWLYDMRPLYGLLRFVHLAGTAGFVGTIVLMDVRLLGFFPEASLQAMRRPLVSVLHVSFLALVVSGVLLFLRDPLGVGLHSMFLPKLLLIVFGLIHAHGLRRVKPARRIGLLRRLAAGSSLAVWLMVIGASTWNHVERPINPVRAMHAVGIGR
jgi:hypothetical protein